MLTENEFVEKIDGYSSDADYEDLHLYMEGINPNLFNEQYPKYVALNKKGVSDDSAVNTILEDELGWIWQ